MLDDYGRNRPHLQFDRMGVQVRADQFRYAQLTLGDSVFRRKDGRDAFVLLDRPKLQLEQVQNVPRHHIGALLEHAKQSPLLKLPSYPTTDKVRDGCYGIRWIPVSR